MADGALARVAYVDPNMRIARVRTVDGRNITVRHKDLRGPVDLACSALGRPPEAGVFPAPTSRFNFGLRFRYLLGFVFAFIFVPMKPNITRTACKARCYLCWKNE